MEKFWFRGYEVLDLLKWNAKELKEAWEFGLLGYENQNEPVYPDVNFLY